MNQINKLSSEVFAANVKKGFYDGEKNIGEMIALIHSELSEMLEADRAGKHIRGDATVNRVLSTYSINEPATFQAAFKADVKDTFPDELADVVIRCLDLAGYMEINLSAHIDAKMKYNKHRPHKHGKKY